MSGRAAWMRWVGLVVHGMAAGFGAALIAEGQPVMPWALYIGFQVACFTWNATLPPTQQGDPS